MNDEDNRSELIRLTDQAIDWRHDSEPSQTARGDHWLIRLIRRLFRKPNPPGVDDEPRDPVS